MFCHGGRGRGNRLPPPAPGGTSPTGLGRHFHKPPPPAGHIQGDQNSSLPPQPVHPSTRQPKKVLLPLAPRACPIPLTTHCPCQPAQDLEPHCGSELRWATARAESSHGSPQAVKLGSISTSHQQEWPGCLGYSRARLWANASRGSLHGQPAPAPGTHSAARRFPRTWWRAVSPQRAEAVSPAVCVSPQRPRWGLHGLGSAKVPQGWGRAGHRGAARQGAAGAPGAVPALICLAVRRAAGGQRPRVPWQLAGPGLRLRPRGLPSQAGGESPQQAPRNPGLGCAFSDFSVCSCSM